MIIINNNMVKSFSYNFYLITIFNSKNFNSGLYLLDLVLIIIFYCFIKINYFDENLKYMQRFII